MTALSVDAGAAYNEIVQYEAELCTCMENACVSAVHFAAQYLIEALRNYLSN